MKCEKGVSDSFMERLQNFALYSKERKEIVRSSFILTLSNHENGLVGFGCDSAVRMNSNSKACFHCTSFFTALDEHRLQSQGE